MNPGSSLIDKFLKIDWLPIFDLATSKLMLNILILVGRNLDTTMVSYCPKYIHKMKNRDKPKLWDENTPQKKHCEVLPLPGEIQEMVRE